MFAAIVCPTCQHKYSIPEGAMGKRQTCPNCHSPFLAGITPAEGEHSLKVQPVRGAIGAGVAAGALPLNKTMLGETAPPVRYHCPSCKKPLESPASAIGTKKPCPACGQRLQVPAAPPGEAASAAASAAPSLNKTMLVDRAPPPELHKTMLAEREPPAPPIHYNCPSCKKPLVSPASEAGGKMPCPACGQRLQVPAASPAAARPNLNKTMLVADERTQPASVAAVSGPFAAGPGAAAYQGPAASDSSRASESPARSRMVHPYWIAAAIVAAVLLLVLFMSGPSRADREKYEKAQQDFLKAQQDLENLKKSILEKEFAVAETKKWEAEQKLLLDKLMDAQKSQRDRLELQIQQDRENAAYRDNQKLAEQAREKRRLEQLEIDRQERDRLAERARFERELKEKMDKLTNDLNAANSRVREATVIVSHPPQPIYYPPFHPFHWRYGFGW